MKKIILFLFTITLAADIFAQASAGMTEYRNERYDYFFNYPSDFGGMGESPSGDGQIFVSPDGENHIRVTGGFNAQTLFGTSFQEEYQSEIEKLKSHKAEILDQGTMDDPDDEFDAAYVFTYLLDGLCYHRRTIWWDDRSATVEFSFYKEDAPAYENIVDRVIYSLTPVSRFLTESQQVLSWYQAGGYLNRANLEGNSTIADFVLSYAVSYQTPLTMMVIDKFNDPNYMNEDIAEWVLDSKNGYLRIRLVNDFDYWLEACYWNMDNGHKLFVVNHNAPTQALLAFDYDPEAEILTPFPQALRALHSHPDAIVRLPRKGKNLTLYSPDDLQTPIGTLPWNGNGFKLKIENSP